MSQTTTGDAAAKLQPQQLQELLQATIERADEIKQSLNKIVQTGAQSVEKIETVLPAEKVQEAWKVISEQTGDIRRNLEEVHDVVVQKMNELQNSVNQNFDPTARVSVVRSISIGADDMKQKLEILGEVAGKKMNDIATTVNKDIEEAKKILAAKER